MEPNYTFEDIEKHKNDIYVLRKDLNSVIPQHIHSQGHITVVIDGVATIQAGKHSYYIPYGYFAWVPGGVLHHVSFEVEQIKILTVYYPPTEEPEFFREIGTYPIHPIMFETLKILQEQTADFTRGDWQFDFLLALKNAMPHINLQKNFNLRLPMSSHPVIEKIVAQIKQQYGSRITAKSIASDVGLSVRTLSRYMRNELDISFNQYVRTYRVLMAIKEMTKGDDTISNIAYNVGYDSLTAFSNAFYTITGTRPSHFIR